MLIIREVEGPPDHLKVALGGRVACRPSLDSVADVGFRMNEHSAAHHNLRQKLRVINQPVHTREIKSMQIYIGHGLFLFRRQAFVCIVPIENTVPPPGYKSRFHKARGVYSRSARPVYSHQEHPQ